MSTSSNRLPAWKEEVNARLHEHRNRRGQTAEKQPALPGMEGAVDGKTSRASSLAARVAERYANIPSYSEMLAAEAARAARAAEEAARAAQEVHAAAQALLAELPVFCEEPEAEFALTPPAAAEPVVMIASREPEWIPEPVRYKVSQESLPEMRKAPPQARAGAHPMITEAEEPATDLYEEALREPAQPLPARILEFPRELIASRKARPRIAEGPLRDAGEPEQSQLRIFEVEADAISTEPVTEPVLTEWHSIRLDAAPEGEMPEPKRTAEPSSVFALDMPLHTAPLEDRLMAAIVDVALVLGAFLLFVLVFVACTAHPPSGKPALIAAACALLGLSVLYQWIFFSWASGTPGMRYAKIALCTFDDENPTRRAMRGRVAALLLSALPLGLGFLWAFFDEDHLGWHDRITRTYQRSYR
ncbi:RDD family protein [Paracidobacterium acidisoli]|uniref:RDD family protein n=1 Tax=Paracidobacterium acidisoli TaxID=2303751 RepID=A0A372IMF1_9BACT|nr:RDD family protein [Paracidobacterium acidisoli]MBT9331747.1 RDD family protein [Paracidobacterium acidisoli]